MGVELIEPELHQARGSFHGAYVIPKERRDRRYAAFPRLLDCMVCVAASDDPEYMDAPDAGEFAVVDVVTKEKAWFELPYGATPEIVHALIEGHFGAQAFRVGDKLWFV